MGYTGPYILKPVTIPEFCLLGTVIIGTVEVKVGISKPSKYRNIWYVPEEPLGPFECDAFFHVYNSRQVR